MPRSAGSNRNKLMKSYGVLLVPPLFLPESYGGAEQQTLRYATELKRRGISASIFTVRLKSATSAQDIMETVPVTRVLLKAPPFLGGKHTLSLLKWSVNLLLHLWSNRRRIEIVHVIHSKLHGVAAILGARLLGMKVVAKLGRSGEHFDLDRVRDKKLYGPLCAWFIARYVHVFVANSREIRSDLLRWGVADERIANIPNGVLIPSEDSKVARMPNSFVYAGRLDPEKAVDTLLEGLAKLEHRRWQLDILGDGECMDDLQKCAQHLGLSENVVFHGAVKAVQEWLKQSEFYVSSSLSEGMSNALLEAMSHGTIPLVTRVGGVADAVDDGISGMLAMPGDLPDYARILRGAVELTAHDRNEMSRQACEAVKARFSMDVVAQRHLQLYESLLGRA